MLPLSTHTGQIKIPDRMCWQLSEMQQTQHRCLNAGKWTLPNAHLQIGLWEMGFGEHYDNFSGFCAAAVSPPSLPLPTSCCCWRCCLRDRQQMSFKNERVSWDSWLQSGAQEVRPSPFSTYYYGGSNLLQTAGVGAPAKAILKMSAGAHTCTYSK